MGLFKPDQNPTPGYFNLDHSLIPHWNKAVCNVRALTGRGKLLMVGDSTNSGAGSGSSGTLNLVGARPKSWPTDMATLLTSFVACSDLSLWNNNGVQPSTTYTLYDPRFSITGSGFGAGAGIASLGGGLFTYTTGSACTVSFTPTAAFDTIVIYYVRNTSQGSFTTNVDGGASLGTTTTAGAAAVLTQTYTVTRSTHTINLVCGNNGNLNLIGFYVYDSTVPAIDMIQAGWVGAKASDFAATANPWSSINLLKTLAPDLTIINLTINDSNNLSGVSTYSTNLQTIITAAKISGDVILMVGPPSNTTPATDGTLDQYIAAMYGLASSNGCPVVDLKSRWTSYAFINPIMSYFDTLHPTAVPYQDVARASLRILAL